MLTKRIFFKGYKTKKNNFKVRKKLKLLIKEKNPVLFSLSKSYTDSFSKKKLARYKKLNNFRVIGMGGSILGTQAIYNF